MCCLKLYNYFNYIRVRSFIPKGAPFATKPRTFPFSICLPAMAACRMCLLPMIRMALSSTSTASMSDEILEFFKRRLVSEH
jgi:hypothetical protein